MSENKREMLKVTIETNGKTEVIECHGLAMTTLEDTGKTYEAKVALVGCMSNRDLRYLRETVAEQLIPAINNVVVEHSSTPNKDDIKDLLKKLLEHIEGE